MNTAERVRHLSVAEYHMMGEAGIFAPDERVELIKGVVHSMTPIGATHSWTVNLVARAFMSQFGAPYIVAVQNPVTLADDSEPQPDIAVVRMLREGEPPRNPRATDVFLVVEVSDTTLTFDRTVKVPLYAAAGIPETWVIDTAAAIVEQYLSPQNGAYQETRRWRKGDSIPTTLGAEIEVSEILV